MPKALFLDRDGVINVDHGYVSHLNDFEFIDGIFELCRAAVDKGYLLVVVTNQAGIGRGMYNEQDFMSLTDWMKSCFEQEHCALTAVYFCPTHPVHGIGKYRTESEFRKPNSGMILSAALEYNISLKESIIIGDALTDIEAGKRAGLEKTILFNSMEKHADAIQISSLCEAIKYL
jgi:D-glycero-D-manno-heptose 1,7-bisphosphate phosphatase